MKLSWVDETNKVLQVLITSFKGSVHFLTIEKRLGINGSHGIISNQKQLLMKKTQRPVLHLAQKRFDDPKDIGENIDLIDKIGTFWKVCIPLHLA